MLQELYVKDFAIIDSMHLSFNEGLTVLSGETGAGKSIIAGALGLLMGGRASAELIRTARDEAVVEAIFNSKNNPRIKKLLSSWGLGADDDPIILRRTISRGGKNKIFIGNRLATTQMLSQIGGHLIDISGQYSQQLLLQTDHHIDIIDAFGNGLSLRKQYQDIYDGFKEKASELKYLLTCEDEIANKNELLTFQYDEIKKGQFFPEEEDLLLKERKILSNSKNLYEKTYRIYSSIYEDDSAYLMALKKNLRELGEASEIDHSLEPLKERFESFLINLEDTAFSLRDYAEKVNMDQGRLEAVEDRLDEIQLMKKKYGKSIEDILTYQKEIESELKGIAGSSKRIEELRQSLFLSADRLWEVAEQLSEKRMKAAAELKRKVEAELAAIGMEKSSFTAVIRRAEKASFADPEMSIKGLNSCGMDDVEFVISPNQGEDSKPLSRIASGGEMSRIVLAIKKFLLAIMVFPHFSLMK